MDTGTSGIEKGQNGKEKVLGRRCSARPLPASWSAQAPRRHGNRGAPSRPCTARGPPAARHAAGGGSRAGRRRLGGVPGGRHGDPRRGGVGGEGGRRRRRQGAGQRERERDAAGRGRQVLPGVEGGDRGAGGAARAGGVAARGAAPDPRAARAGVRGGGDQPPGPRRAGRHGRRLPPPARAHGRRRHARHRAPARRRAPGGHGRATHPGGRGVGAQEQEPREDARVRARRACGHAPRRRQDPQGPRAPPQGHSEASVPAGGGVRVRREAYDRGRRAGGRGGHLRRARLAPAPDVRDRVPDGGPPRRLRLLQGRDPRRRAGAAAAVRGPRPGRVVDHHQPPEPRLPRGGPPGLAGGVGGRGERERRRRAAGSGRHVPRLLERELLPAAAADRGGDRGAVAGARVRGGRGLLRGRELLPADGERRADVRARAARGVGAAGRGGLPRRAGDDGRRGLLLLLAGGARGVLLHRGAERDAGVRAHGALALLHDRRGRAPHRRRRARRHRREVPRRPRLANNWLPFLRRPGRAGALTDPARTRARLVDRSIDRPARGRVPTAAGAGAGTVETDGSAADRSGVVGGGGGFLCGVVLELERGLGLVQFLWPSGS